MASAHPLASHNSDRQGDRIGPYQLRSVLGEGGMGVVYLAEGPQGERVALKLVKPEYANDRMFRRRFEREARIAQQVEHRHLVPVLAVGHHDGTPYIAQEFIPGGSLHDKITAEGTLALVDTVKICLEIARGLEALHRAGLVHRDLKPANVLLGEDGFVYLTDFGIAKDRDATVLTRPGQALGSVDYMAPEQIRGEEVTSATDVYALGCLTCECLCGSPPFSDRKGVAVLWAHIRDEPPDPCVGRADTPKDVTWVISRSLEKDPAKRPPGPMAFSRMLQVAAGVPPLSPQS
jgi:serine/threonine protein kinase